MKGSDFIFDYVDGLSCLCHKIRLNCPDQISDKMAAINPINKCNNRCFQYAATAALNHEEIGKNLERISKIKPFVGEYDRKGIN